MSDIDLLLTGSLHPHLLVTVNPKPCDLHLHLSLPDALFPDPDELSDQWGTSRTWSVVPRNIDIERPFNLAAPKVNVSLVIPPNTPLVDIPLHARYLPPSKTGGHDVVVFGNGGGEVRSAWACGTAEAPQLQILDTHLILHLPAAKSSYQVPVEVTTATVVWLGWAWLMYKLVAVMRGGKAKGKTE